MNLVKESHRKLAADLCRSATGSNRALHHVPKFAQLIADSEAKAVASALSNVTCTHHNDKQRAECPVCLVAALTAERDQLLQQVANLKYSNHYHREIAETWRSAAIECNRLRAELDAIEEWKKQHGDPAKDMAQLRAVFPQILAALGNGAGCTPEVSVEFIQSIPNAVAGVIHRLREEVQRLKADGAASAFVNMSCRASRAEADASKLTDALDMMRDEFMRIIACPGCNAEIEDLANRAQLKLIQRVPVITQRDRAEAELAKANAILASIEEDGTEEHNAAVRLRQELAAERAKVRALRSACERLRDCDWVITLPDRMDAVRDIARAAIDAAV